MKGKSEKKRRGHEDMLIGNRLRSLRERKGLSQGDIEKSTGLLRCYISRVENGHTVPSLETLERFATALEVPLYRLFYAGEGEAPTPNLTERLGLQELAEQGGKEGEEARFLLHLNDLLKELTDPDRKVLLTLAKKLATH
jgi:transcriptional regulator with XRE-family HTH domain